MWISFHKSKSISAKFLATLGRKMVKYPKSCQHSFLMPPYWISEASTELLRGNLIVCVDFIKGCPLSVHILVIHTENSSQKQMSSQNICVF